MSPTQLEKLQALSQVFSNGTATPQQLQQLSLLLAEINCNTDKQLISIDDADAIMPNNILGAL